MHYLIFSRSNYIAMVIKMKVVTQDQVVWDIMEPRNPQNLVGVKKDKMTRVTIYQGIP